MATASTKGKALDLALNMARQSLYRFSSLALSDPRLGSWERLRDKRTQQTVARAAALVRSEPTAKASKLARGELPLSELDPAPIFARLPASSSGLNDAYEGAFGLLVSGACPPYETEYLNSKFTFQRSQQLADVSGFYRAFGLEPSSEHPERHDHIVLELEFMAFLLGMERRASESADPDREDAMAVCRDAQEKFLEQHIVWWAPTFAKLLSMENPEGYYGALSRFLSALMAAERALLGIMPPSTTASPSKVERPEECEGCLLQP